jgi:hypothetical protein
MKGVKGGKRMKALLKVVLMLVSALAYLAAFGLVFSLVERLGVLGALFLIIVLTVVPVVYLEVKKDRGELKGWFDTPSTLPSFANGYPVSIELPGQSITIDSEAVHVRVPGVLEALWENFTWLLRRDFDAPLDEYSQVRLSGEYEEIPCEGPPGQILAIRVTLVHPHRNKTLLLGERKWGGLETIDDFSDNLVLPLRQLCKEAAHALSLPAHEEGVLTRAELSAEQRRLF